jgi:glycosyltransferase involved in cell wall biosynthesis
MQTARPLKNTSASPLVSIIIPCWNAERYVAEAIDSALAQTWPHKEIIVVDDGSTDGSLEVIRRFGDHVCLVQIRHSGAPTARNEGLRRAQGDYIKFLDADDVLLPEAVSRLVEAIQSLPENAIPYGQVLDYETRKELFREIRTSEATSSDDMILACFASNIPTTAPLYRVGLLRAVKGFDPDLERGQEWDLHLRLALQGVIFCYVQYPVSLCRRHNGKYRINTRLRLPVGVEWRAKSVGKGVRLIQEHFADVIPPQFKEVMYLHFYNLGLGYARWGQRRKAEHWFDLARSLGVKPPRMGDWLYRVLRKLLGDYLATRTLTVARDCVFRSFPYQVLRKCLRYHRDRE